MDGEIKTGDSDRFARFLARYEQNSSVLPTFILNSGGGNVADAVRIASAILQVHRQSGVQVTTIVRANTRCASACFLIFTCGNPKIADPSSMIGIHSFNDGRGNERESDRAAEVVVARLLHQCQVPNDLIAKMIITPGTEIYWLTLEDLKNMGATADEPPPPDPSPRTEPPVKRAEPWRPHQAPTSRDSDMFWWNIMATVVVLGIITTVMILFAWPERHNARAHLQGVKAVNDAMLAQEIGRKAVEEAIGSIEDTGDQVIAMQQTTQQQTKSPWSRI